MHVTRIVLSLLKKKTLISGFVQNCAWETLETNVKQKETRIIMKNYKILTKQKDLNIDDTEERKINLIK